MSYKIGKNLICDCCGATYFLENYCCGGGILKTEEYKYSPKPEGWIYSADFGDLCPICSKNYVIKMRDLFGYDKLPEQWRELLI